MSIHGGKSFGRGVVAVCAAGALLVSLLASPASADVAPSGTSIKGVLKGGEIVLHQDPPKVDRVFPLGEKDGSSVKEKTGDSVCDSELNEKKEPQDRSYFWADVDGAGKMSNFAFSFAQGSTGEKFNFLGQEYEVCAQLEVKNAAQIQGQITDKQVTLDKGPQVSVDFVIKTKPQGQENWRCRIEIAQDNHAGKFSEAKDSGAEKPQHHWDLVHEPKNQPFMVPQVQATTECPSFVANQLNSDLQLPTTGTASFKWWVHDCNLKDCTDPDPNK